MRLHRSFLTLVTLGLLAGLLCAAPAAAAYEFPRVDGLEGNVAFWRNVYAVWSENEIAFHDRKDFHIVYRVVKVPPRTDGKARRKAIVKARSELTAALKQLNKTQPKTGDGLEGVELEVWTNLKDIRHADKYRRLSTIRAQNGLRERFVAGYVSAGAYERQIRDRLALAGLPEEIVALAYLESLMDIRAVSHAGAVGMWQFMRPTAKEYMHVNNVVDERMDPIIAADAAAKYINQALKEVGPWPVAITSYNYGRAGMRRAIKGAGSDDLGVILKKFTSKRFGLAARNYYASFLAVHDVLTHPQDYLADYEQRPAWAYDVVRLPFPILSTQLIGKNTLTQTDLVFLNPALTQSARTGGEALPRGIPLRVPRGKYDAVVRHLLGMSKQERRKADRHVRAWHTANGRETIEGIAGQYGVSASAVASRNGVSASSKPAKGKKIAIPSSPVGYSMFPDAPDAAIPPDSATPTGALRWGPPAPELKPRLPSDVPWVPVSLRPAAATAAALSPPPRS
jgi:membrane-bound lytic murein transglycosylase D